jgi:uncharacterized membrane protein YbhN (UPF0104 family)
VSSRRASLLLTGAAGLAIATTAAFPHVLRHLQPAFEALAGANRLWLLVAGVFFLAAFVCTVGAWRAAFASAGARICPRQAAARLGVGAMVNSFAPAKLGDAVKIALFSRAIERPGRLWTAGGAYASLTATRALALSTLVVASSATGAMPLWPVFVLLAGAGAIAIAATLSSRFRSHERVAQLFAGVEALVRSPRALAAVCGWTLGMQLARLGGTVAAAVALGLPHPFLAALVILPALDVAGAIPLTPGSIGVGSGAVAVALATRGIGMGEALGVGLALQAVETSVSIACGTCGLAYLFRPAPRARRIALRVALVGASATLAALVGAMLLDLV